MTAVISVSGRTAPSDSAGSRRPGSAVATFLMSPPDHYDTHFMFNPWLDYSESVDKKRAVRQWHVLAETLEALGASIEILEPNPQSPAQVFTADGALGLSPSHYLVLCNDGARGLLEPHRFGAWLTNHGHTIEQLPPHLRLDGGNIVALGGGTIAAGIKPGSDGRTERYLGGLLRLVSGRRLEIFPLRDRRYLHLDMVLGRLGDRAFLIYEDGFEDPGDVVGVIERHGRPVIRVDIDDARRLACNGVMVGGTWVTNGVSSSLRSKIERVGLEVAEVGVDEFLKAGGGVKCLTLPLADKERKHG